MQFDPRLHNEAPITFGNYTLKSDDFVLGCHIPSGSPLKHQLCLNSYKLAYEYFKDRIRDGILPVICKSWLLYSPYIDVFGRQSNTAQFALDFQIYDTVLHQRFADAWRIFGDDFNGNADELPSDTRIQRSFIEYIKNGGNFGMGCGILLFDGEKVLTQRML